MTANKTLIHQLDTTHHLSAAQWHTLLDTHTPDDDHLLTDLARKTAQEQFGKKIYMRGLIEFTNYCKNDCYYCGIRCSNHHAQRYRLSPNDILACCEEGYTLGFRTFVLQGGEDAGIPDEELCQIITAIKQRYPDCAVTLSVGEREHAVYQSFFDAGADRFLLRHETADAAHYQILHPPVLTAEHRKVCLWDLKKIGFQVGAGFMVGSPGQSHETIVKDLLFLQELQPHMVGIGPFLPHRETPFHAHPAGSTELTLFLLSCVRLMLPHVLLPATTALGTAASNGREQGILAGANVVMPNLSPQSVRKKYMLYDNKVCTGDESAQAVSHLKQSLAAIGYELSTDRGDSPLMQTQKRSPNLCTI